MCPQSSDSGLLAGALRTSTAVSENSGLRQSARYGSEDGCSWAIP